MSDHDQIIDVTPLNHSSSRISVEQPRVSREQRGQRGQRREPKGKKSWSPTSALGGIAQMALGAGLVAVGIPLLILPGPGLLVIGAGVMLAARGLSKVTARD